MAKFEQIYSVVNDIAHEFLGETAVVNEDLSNIVEIGKSLQEMKANGNITNNVFTSLVDKVGKMVCVARTYGKNGLGLTMDNWSYGSVLEKCRANIKDVEQTLDYGEDGFGLVDGQSYEAHVYYKPSITVKFYNSMTTFTCPISFTDHAIWTAFSSASEMNSFVSMIRNSIEQTMDVRTQLLEKRLVNTLIALKIKNEESKPAGVVHLLTEYNKESGRKLTATTAKMDVDFLKYCAKTIKCVSGYMANMGKAFTNGDYPVFTPKEYQHSVMLNDFSSCLDVYMQSDTFHNEYTEIGKRDTVPCWQGIMGDETSYDFDTLSKIDVKVATPDGKGATVSKSGIVGIIFDKDAAGISLFNKRVNTDYTASADFITEYHKEDARYFVDDSENAVVFVLD